MPESDTGPLAAMRRARGLTQEQVAARWNTAHATDRKTFRTVSRWETGRVEPSVDVLRGLADIYGCTVGQLLGERVPAPLAVSLAVVTWGRRVLLVRNRDSDRWQFPAGQVKPGRDPQATAVRECRAETGVHVSVTVELGQRVHPRTDALCRYYAADYVAGDAENLDADENTDVLWVPIASLAEFIPLDEIFGPVRDHLGVSRCLTSA